MRNETRRELLTGAQYFLIGIIAQVAVVRWGCERALEGPAQLLLWITVFLGISLLRLFILSIANWTQRDRWRTISRRHWN
jgi:hypothetical protein